MSRRLLPRLFAALAALALVSPAARAADEATVEIPHHGRLLTSDDAPATGLHRLTFTVYKNAQRPADGSADESLWTDSYEVQVERGLYALTLGRGGTAGTPLTGDVFVGARFLGIKVDDGPELTPRLRIGAVPHALFADNVVRGGQNLFDATGHFTGPTDNLPFAAIDHDHDTQYLKLSDVPTLASKDDLTLALGDYYPKAAVDQKLAALDPKFTALSAQIAAVDAKFPALDPRFSALDAKITALDGKLTTSIAGLSSTYTTKTEAQAFAKTADVNENFLSKADAASTYATKDTILPIGTLVLNEDPSNPVLEGAGFTLFGSLPSGWASKPGGPLSTAYRARGAFVDGKVYFPGGYISSPSTAYGCAASSYAVRNNLVFNTRTNAWSSAATLATPRYGHAVLTTGGKVYALGGLSCSNSPSTAAEVYDPATNRWATTNAIPDSDSHYLGAASDVDGKLYLVGGYTSSTSAYNGAVHAFDTTTGTWATKAAFPHVIHSAAAATLDGKLYVFGGVYLNATTTTLSAETWAYDPATNGWTRMTDMPAGLRLATAAAIAGKIHVFGGLTNATASTSGYISNAHYVFDPTDPENPWVSAEPLPWNAYAASSVSIGTRAFIFGGMVYNPATYGYNATNTFAEYNAGLYIYRKEQ